eukprot:3157696-Ditylum_brightwellii.AAC.1
MLFYDECKSQGQHISFCGVGAHHQNGIAENWIKQLTFKSRSMILHAKQHWPEYITAILWAYASKTAEDHCNKYETDDDGVSPDKKFQYLDSPLSAYANNVHLVLNPRTGHVLPQFHVDFDDNVATTPHLRVGTMPPLWASLVVTELLPLRDPPSGTWELLDESPQ